MKCMLVIFFVFYKIMYGYINIYPSKFEKNIENGVNETFRLYNRTGKEIRYRIYLEETVENDMTKWIELYPKSITLNPLEEKEVNLFINPPKDAKHGKYRSKLIVKEVDIPGKKRFEKVKFMTMFKLTMIGYIGEDR